MNITKEAVQGLNQLDRIELRQKLIREDITVVIGIILGALHFISLMFVTVTLSGYAFFLSLIFGAGALLIIVPSLKNKSEIKNQYFDVIPKKQKNGRKEKK